MEVLGQASVKEIFVSSLAKPTTHIFFDQPIVKKERLISGGGLGCGAI